MSPLQNKWSFWANHTIKETDLKMFRVLWNQILVMESDVRTSKLWFFLDLGSPSDKMNSVLNFCLSSLLCHLESVNQHPFLDLVFHVYKVRLIGRSLNVLSNPNILSSFESIFHSYEFSPPRSLVSRKR